MKRNLKFTFRANVDTIVAYEFYESRRKNIEERFLNLRNIPIAEVADFGLKLSVNTDFASTKPTSN